jgi:uncharacterized repeat protein (TIGR01451 family)
MSTTTMLTRVRSRLFAGRRALIVLASGFALGLAGMSTAAQAASTDLSVTVIAAPGPAGGQITFTTTVHNAGPADATNVVLTSIVPANVINIVASPAGCAFDNTGTRVVCQLGTVAAGAAVVSHFTVHPVTIGMKSSTSTVSSVVADTNPANNSATASINLTEVGISDLAVTLSDSPDPLRAGSTLVYSAIVRNIGDDTARDVVLTDALPAGMTFLTATAGQGACALSGGVVVCKLGSMNPGTVATVRIAVRANATGIVYNTVGVSLSRIDPNLTNNAATVGSWVNP